MKRSASSSISGWLRGSAALLVGMTTLFLTSAVAETRKSFDAPEAAAQALVDALKANDEKTLIAILGRSLKEWIDSGDPVADRNARDDFVSAYDKKHAIEHGEADQGTLLIGEDDFPFSIPLVKKADKWSFDPELGKQEMIDRRVGENELSTIQTLLAIVDAQYEYVSSNPEKKGARAYARSFISSPGKRDGLYWPAEDEVGEKSPLGELVAEAATIGYNPTGQGGGEASLVPFNGYYFRMLKGQGPNAEGGAYSYMVNDRMMGGFGVIAWPAKYGASGYKTFIVNHDQDVYEADLGPDTAALVKKIKTFDPDKEWTKSELEAPE
jgi:hypothetical protein